MTVSTKADCLGVQHRQYMGFSLKKRSLHLQDILQLHISRDVPTERLYKGFKAHLIVGKVSIL
ncbi:hypothetical protein [Richelia sinica]|uniref:hypothetical protein n=1 Tax=Richelia sinica TaxID=1357545 RepID=UPI001684DE69|nr:hypothetical protein [Richelia sinica]MBD2665522.1 hypothetical protein [Richelia sinica FACHB-800]